MDIAMKVQAKWLGLLLALAYLFAASYVFAFTLPSHPDNYVNDYAQMLSPQAKEKLNQQLRDFQNNTTTQLVVVTIPSLENQTIEDYSIHLAELWKIGTREHNNGIILLLSKAEHQVRIEVGYGLEGVLPDSVAEMIIQTQIRPFLTQGKIDKGVAEGIEAIIAATKNEYHADTSNLAKPTHKASMPLSLYLFLAAVGLGILGFIRAQLLTYAGRSDRIHTPFWDTVDFLFRLLGKIILAVLSSRGSRGGSGGSAGGGGGGSFGGGGASGNW